MQRPDGSLDPEVEQMLEQMAVWSAVHGEAIFGSRPWLVYGEGAVKAKGGSFKEDYTYSAKDIRFTTKGATLYALALGWPENNQLTIRSLAKPNGDPINRISGVTLLGYSGKIAWTQSADGLVVTLPATKVSDLTVGLKIIGSDLKPVPIPEVVETIHPDANGNVTLSADNATLHGDQIKVEDKAGKANIGFWDRADEWASWNVRFTTPGVYRITADIATQFAGSEFVVEVAGRQITATAPNTGGWDRFETVDIGQVEIKQPGDLVVKVRPRDASTWKAINLQGFALKPVR